MTALEVPDTRIRAALDRYDRVLGHEGRPSRPGEPAPAEVVSARLDLVLLLTAAGEDLPDPVVAQVAVDADLLLRRTQAI